MRLRAIVFALFFFSCTSTTPIPDTPVEPSPDQGELRARLIDHSEGGELIPGRIRATLAPELWNQEFDPSSSGVTRLREQTQLMNLFACYPLERVWRTFAQVEWRQDGRIEVIPFQEWARRTASRRALRPNQTSAQLPPLAGVENEFELRFATHADLHELVAEMKKLPGVISAELVRRPPVTYTPNDPGWVASGSPSYDATLARGRWGMHNTGAALGSDYLDDFDIDAPEAWDIQRGDPQVTVAIFDAHADVAHEDLYLNIFLNNGEVPSSIVTSHRAASATDGLPGELTFYDLNEPAVVTALAALGHVDTNANGRIDGVDVVSWWSNGDDADLNGYVDDLVGWNFEDGTNRPFESVSGVVSSHGVGVAGLVAAIADNGAGVAGVAHGTRILPVNSNFQISEIVYALSFPSIRVINHSMSSNFRARPADVNALLSTLEAAGVLYVASLGNKDAFYYGGDPSKREEVVSVSNFDRTGKRATGGSGQSGYGPKTDVAAPAHGVYSLQLGGGVRSFGGTSGASPMTAATGALVASEAPSLSPEQIRQTLRMTAVDPAPVTGDRSENTPGWDLYSGWGLVNAFSALDAVRSGTRFPAANIISQPANFRNPTRNEELAIGSSIVDLRAVAGIPGESVNWTLRRSGNWDFSAAVFVASGRTTYSDGTRTLATLNTDPLDGRQVLELEVRTDSGVVGKDRAVIDLPRAYIAELADEQTVVSPREIRGFAYGPGFTRYVLQVAPGWSPAPSDFVDVHVGTTPQQPALPVEPGVALSSRVLHSSFDPSTLSIPFPDSGQFTLRLLTEGDRIWTDEIRLLGPHSPAIRPGFPVPSFYSNLAAPTAVDLDGDGIKELIVSGNGGYGQIRAYDATGTMLPGWDISLASGDYLWDAPAVGDIDGDGRPEIVVRSIMETAVSLHVIEHDGTLRSGAFPLSFDAPPLDVYNLDQRPPVLADVTGDGRLDVLVALDKSPSIPSPRIKVIDGVSGSEVRDYEAAAVFDRMGTLVAADIDGDGEIEIVATAASNFPSSERSDLYVWRRDGTIMWRSDLPTYRSEGPVACDLDGDGRLELTVGALGSGVFYFDHDGSLISRNSRGEYRYGLGCVEFSPASSGTRAYWGSQYIDSVKVTIADPGTPTAVDEPGWPAVLSAGPGARQSSDPVAADLQGDARLEIGFGNDYFTYEPGAPVLFGLANAGASLIEDGEWPIRFVGGIETTPVVTDLEDDGRPELVIQTTRPERFVYVFDLGTSTHPGWVAWGEHRHDPRRSANYHGAVRILHPSTARRQRVGPFDDASLQGALVVRTEFSRGKPVAAGDPANWTVSIGGARAPVREVASVQGEQWLLVDPITQPAAGPRDLRVEFNDGGLLSWDSYLDAVEYDPSLVRHTTIPVIDKSGSMLGAGKIDAARVAAGYFAESAYPGDDVGVVAFNAAADDRLGTPSLLEAGSNRVTIAGAIATLSAGGSTSIGAGLAEALDILETSADPAHQWGIVLLSDGLENTAPFWERSGTLPPVRSRAESLASGRAFQINTIALGPDADHSLLQEIADATGGDFYAVALGHSISMLNRLADVYHYARENIDGTRRLHTHAQALPAGDDWDRDVVVPRAATRLQFALNWEHPIAEELLIIVSGPDGTSIDSRSAGVTITRTATSAVYTIRAPSPGRWNVRVVNRWNEEVETLLAASASIPWREELRVRITEMEASIAAFVIGPRGFDRNAKIEVLVVAPDKSSVSIELRDDGMNGDGAAGDGIYGGIVPASQAGSYQFEATATIRDATPEPFTITRTLARFNRDASDRDADGMIDERELRYTKCPNGLNPHDDPDGDGVDNFRELQRGTNPFIPDAAHPTEPATDSE